MADEIPQWAIERACDLANSASEEPPQFTSWRLNDVRLGDRRSAGMLAFARYIAQHEEPPVDPFEATIAEAYEAMWEGKEGLTREDAVHRLAIELRKRGMELAKDQDHG